MADLRTMNVGFRVDPDSIRRMREVFQRYGLIQPDWAKEGTMPESKELSAEQLVCDVREAEATRDAALAECGEVMAVMQGVDAGLARIIAITDPLGGSYAGQYAEVRGIAEGLRYAVRALRRTLDEPDA